MLRFIGTGSAFNTALGNNSSFYKKGSSMLLLDCGSNIFSRIRQHDLLKNIKSVYVLITHLHPDHAGSLGDLIFYCMYKVKIRMTVLTPDAENLRQLLRYSGVSDELYELINLNGKHEIAEGELKVTVEPYQMQHSEKMNCYGYLLDNEGSKIFFSGDCREIRDDIFKKLVDGELSMFYQDTCSYDFPENSHFSLKRLEEKVAKELRSKVCCMHLDEDFDVQAAVDLGFKVARNEFE